VDTRSRGLDHDCRNRFRLVRVVAAIAFFPWLESREALKVGAIRLTPYERRKLPGDQPRMTQVDIDGVLKAYSRKPANRGDGATILELGPWKMGMEPSRRVISRLFHVRELIAFSALATRRLFSNFNYCNYHAYTLVVQRFQPGSAGTFAFTTRRRDGRTNQLWGSEEFAFHIPNHVRGHTQVQLDQKLLKALLRAPKAMSHVFEAIREFNTANTDSSDIPEHVEIVMVKSAFEWLLGINERADVFQKAVAGVLQDIPTRTYKTGPMARRWRARWNNRPIEAWTRDFCAVRSSSAHGLQRNARRASVWSGTSHLAFASMLFPLLLKKVLRDAGLFQMDEYDLERLRQIDAFLMHDPFARKRDRFSAHSWTTVDNEVLRAIRAEKLYGAVTTGLARLQAHRARARRGRRA
jgi:hypothetical protein